MSRNKAWQILDTPNTVQLYFMFYSRANCVLLSQLEKIKLLVPGGKKALETVFQAQLCLQRGQSPSVWIILNPDSEVLFYQQDWFAVNTRTSMLPAEKSPAVCSVFKGLEKLSKNCESCLSTLASGSLLTQSAYFTEVICGVTALSPVLTHRG